MPRLIPAQMTPDMSAQCFQRYETFHDLSPDMFHDITVDTFHDMSRYLNISPCDTCDTCNISQHFTVAMFHDMFHDTKLRTLRDFLTSYTGFLTHCIRIPSFHHSAEALREISSRWEKDIGGAFAPLKTSIHQAVAPRDPAICDWPPCTKELCVEAGDRDGLLCALLCLETTTTKATATGNAAGTAGR